jgi:ferritin-like metal-binding protein YciE
MAEMKLDELFLMTLKDIYYAENQISKALPKMVEKASSVELQNALTKHHQETAGHVTRLNRVFEILGRPARGVNARRSRV